MFQLYVLVKNIVQLRTYGLSQIYEINPMCVIVNKICNLITYIVGSSILCFLGCVQKPVPFQYYLLKQEWHITKYFNFEQALKDLQDGKTSKTIKHASGSFESQLIKKNQATLTDEITRQILSMFSMGMSYREITNTNPR